MVLYIDILDPLDSQVVLDSDRRVVTCTLSKPMKIVWLRPNKPADISVGRYRLAEALRDRGHDVSVRETTVIEGGRALRLSADVVIGTTRLGAFVGASRKLLRGTPLVVDHIDPIAQFRENSHPVTAWGVARAEEVTFRLADHVMVVYEEEVPRVARYTGAVTETHLGVEYELFANPDPDVVEHAQNVLSNRIRPDARRLVYVGGLEPIYNISTMLEAMDYLPDWELLVLGDGSQRERVASAEAANIHYLGTVGHELVPGFLHESTVGISLVDDPHTLKLLEYGAASLPAVSVAGTAESRFEGLVEFTRLEAKAVGTAVEEAAAHGPVERFQAYAKRFRWESIADQYESACLEACGCTGLSGSH